MDSMIRLLFAGSLWAAAGGVPAHAQEVLFNRVHLQAQATREVPNNEMRVLMVTGHQGKDSTRLAGLVNDDMAWALARAKKHAGVTAATKSYHTYPVYEDQLIAAWRVSQELLLTSEQPSSLTALVGVLQTRLRVRQMRFVPTRASREQVIDELIEEAMLAFKRRAGIVQKQMQDMEYRIVELHVDSDGSFPRPVPHAEMAPMRSMAVPAPAIDTGTTMVTVTVSGSVQFF